MGGGGGEPENIRGVLAAAAEEREGKERDMGGGWPWDIFNAADHGWLSVGDRW